MILYPYFLMEKTALYFGQPSGASPGPGISLGKGILNFLQHFTEVLGRIISFSVEISYGQG